MLGKATQKVGKTKSKKENKKDSLWILKSE